MMDTRTGRTAIRRRGRQALIVVVASVATLTATTNVRSAHALSSYPVWGWGANAYGEIGDGTTTNGSAPVPTLNLPNGATVVAAGARHTLALLGDASVVAWGRNSAGELGNGGTANSSVPVAVSGFGAGSNVVALAGGAPPITLTSPTGDGHSMALKSDGSVFGWGNNTSGEVGNGTASSTVDVLVPTAVVGLGAGSGVVAIAAGASHSMALKSDGTVLTWGNNNSGQLGNGTTTDSPTPVTVSGLGAGSGVIAISAGSAFSVVLKSDGTVLTWGNNASGQLGNNSAPTDSATPVVVSGLGGVAAVAAGDAFMVALNSTGTLKAWGNNSSGQLGDGTAPTDHAVPVNVSGITGASGVAAISVGHSHAVARTSSGTMYAWGRNASGQLGDGTTTQHNTPVLTAVTGITQLAAGGSHTMALRGAVAPATISVGDASVMEGDGGARKLTFPVTLSKPGTQTVTVHYAVGDNGTGAGYAHGAASGTGLDYFTKSGTLTFAVSLTTGKTKVALSVVVTVVPDLNIESNEQFGITLSAPSGGFSLNRSVGVGTIINDDPAPGGAPITIGIGPLQSNVEGDTGVGRTLLFPVNLSKAAAGTVTVQYTVSPISATHGATAAGGADYGGATSGTLSFAVGVTYKTIVIPIFEDISAENDESFAVTLSGLSGLPAGALISSGAYGIILNDDAP